MKEFQKIAVFDLFQDDRFLFFKFTGIISALKRSFNLFDAEIIKKC